MKVVCTFCQVAAVKHHCPDTNTACTWLKCGACGVIYDWQTDKAVDRDGKPMSA